MVRHEGIFVASDEIAPHEVVTARETAEYVENMCAELSRMSDRSGLRFLYYLLEVAREEAATQALERRPRMKQLA